MGAVLAGLEDEDLAAGIVHRVSRLKPQPEGQPAASAAGQVFVEVAEIIEMGQAQTFPGLFVLEQVGPADHLLPRGLARKKQVGLPRAGVHGQYGAEILDSAEIIEIVVLTGGRGGRRLIFAEKDDQAFLGLFAQDLAAALEFLPRIAGPLGQGGQGHAENGQNKNGA